MESEWLLDAIRLSFNASIQTVPGDPKPAPPQRDPKRQKLIDGLLYSRSFILTYHLVILGFVVILSVVHWSGKAIRWRKRRVALLRICGTDAASIEEVPQIGTKSVQDYEGVSSSGSSTVEGTASPPQKDLEDEEAPLLHPGHSPPSLHPRNVGNFIHECILDVPASTYSFSEQNITFKWDLYRHIGFHWPEYLLHIVPHQLQCR
jgi:hypothetical protein